MMTALCVDFGLFPNSGLTLVKSYRGAVAMMNELLRLQQNLLPEFQ